jgi:hypothetical protein
VVDEAAETVGGEAVGGEAVAAVPWVQQDGCCRCLRGGPQSGLGWSVVRTGRLTGGPSGFDIFLELSKPAQI